MTFIPSDEQRAILHAWASTTDNLAIRAGAGTGKCVLPNTMIAINGTLMSAEQVWQDYANNLTRSDGEGEWAIPTRPVYTDSLLPDGAWGKKPITHLYRQYVYETIRTVTLSDRNVIRLTAKHKLYNGLCWTNEYLLGDVVAVPSQLSPGVNQFDPVLAEFVGWLIAEGYDFESRKSAGFAFTMRDYDTLNHIRNLVEQIESNYGLPSRPKLIHRYETRNVHTMRWASKPMHQFLERMGYVFGRRANQKRIPDTLMNASNEAVLSFLRAYFDGEGHAQVDRGYVSSSSASEILTKQVVYLLRRFGVWARIRPVIKSATNGKNIKRTYYQIDISGDSLRTFARNVGFGVVGYKVEALRKAISKPSNTNVDVLPSASVLNRLKIYGLGKDALGLADTRYQMAKNLSREQYNAVRTSLASIAKGQTFSGNQYRPTVTVDNEILSAVHEAIDDLDKLSNQSLKYPHIVNLTEEMYEGWVYDFSVDDTHNFLAENILCHNTTTILEIAKLTPSGRSKCYCAFNKDIVQEVNPKLQGTGVTARTFHSLGASALRKALNMVKGGDFELDDYKYRALVDAWGKDSQALAAGIDQAIESEVKDGYLEPADAKKAAADLFKEVCKMLTETIRFMRLKLVAWDDLEGLRGIVSYYGLDLEIYYDNLIELAIAAVSGIMADSEASTKSRYHIDFTDMIYWPAYWNVRVYQFHYLYVDECQDLSPLQRRLVQMHLYPNGGRIVLVGDEHQCQPAGTLVTMADGTQRPIEQIEAGDKVVSYDRRSGHWMRRGLISKTASRHYAGKLYEVSAGKKTARATNNHKWLVRWENMQDDKWTTYIMRRGHHYRVGIVQMFNTNMGARQCRELGLAARMRAEKADAGWVIGIHDNYVQAYTHEQVVSAKYGLPQLTFNATSGSRGSRGSQSEIDAIHSAIGSNHENATRCLQDHGRNIIYPLVDKTAKWQRRGGSTYFVTESCNLISHYMAIPVAPEPITFHPKTPFKGDFQPIQVKSYQWQGAVYSLEVDRYELYVSDGLLTHNSIYEFAGADSDSWQLSVDMFNAKVYPLNLTRRCSKAVTDKARELVPEFRCPADAPEGVIRYVPQDKIVTSVKPGDMILSRLNAPLIEACLRLIEADVPATILGKGIGKALAQIVEKVEKLKGYEWARFLDLLGEHEERTVAKRIEKHDEAGAEFYRDQCKAMRVVHERYLELENGNTDAEGLKNYIEGLFSDESGEGMVTLATGHKSKGLESERVFILAPERLPLVFDGMRPETMQQERNIDYVIRTRAKNELIYFTNDKFRAPIGAVTTMDSQPALPAPVDEPEIVEAELEIAGANTVVRADGAVIDTDSGEVLIPADTSAPTPDASPFAFKATGDLSHDIKAEPRARLAAKIKLMSDDQVSNLLALLDSFS